MCYAEKEKRDGGNAIDTESIRVIGKNACVLDSSVFLGLNLKKKLTMSKWNLISFLI